MFKGKNILVTGGSGMIGRKVVKLLQERGALVANASLPSNDLRKPYWCEMITRGRDFLFHIAGIKGSGKMTRERPADFLVPMLQMNTNILEAARLNGVKKILYVSSTAVTHDEFPGIAKLVGEKQLEAYKQQYGFDNWVVIRPNNVYGEDDRFDPDNGMFIPALMAKIQRGDNPVNLYGTGEDIRDFIYSGDVAEILVGAMEKTTGIYELGGGNQMTTAFVVNSILNFVDFNFKFDNEGNPTIRVVDSNPIYEATGYKPKVNIKEGLERVWKWYQQNLAKSG